MPRSEAQPDSSRAGTKRPQDNLSKDTPPGSKPRGHKKPAPQRDQIEGEPQRLAFHAENQQSVWAAAGGALAYIILSLG